MFLFNRNSFAFIEYCLTFYFNIIIIVVLMCRCIECIEYILCIDYVDVYIYIYIEKITIARNWQYQYFLK